MAYYITMNNVFAGDVIQLVRNFPCLYDPDDTDYKNTSKREEAWSTIGHKLNHSGDEIKKKWRNLRDTYIKYLKNSKLKRKNNQKMKRWQWAIQMSVYHQYLFHPSRKSESSSALHDDEIENENQTSDRSTPEIFMELEDTEFGNDPIGDDEFKEGSESSDAHFESYVTNNNTDRKLTPHFEILEVTSLTKSSPSALSNPLKRKLMSPERDSAEPTSSAETLLENYQKRDLKLDAVDLLFLAHANTIKSFTGKRQAIAKLKVAEVIMQQEILHHEEQESLGK